MDQVKREQATALLDEMMGPQFRAAIMAAADGDGFGSAMAGLAVEHCFADIWNRGGIDRRTRSLITMAFLLALGKPEEFRNHAKFGLNNGVSKDEIEELIIQGTIYCGFPAASNAQTVAVEVLRERGLLDPQTKTSKDRGLY